MSKLSSYEVSQLAPHICYRYVCRHFKVENADILKGLSWCRPSPATITWLRAYKGDWYGKWRPNHQVEHFIHAYPQYLEQYVLLGGSVDVKTVKFSHGSRTLSDRFPNWNHPIMKVVPTSLEESCVTSYKESIYVSTLSGDALSQHRQVSEKEKRKELWMVHYPEYAVLLGMVSTVDSHDDARVSRIKAEYLDVENIELSQSSMEVITDRLVALRILLGDETSIHQHVQRIFQSFMLFSLAYASFDSDFESRVVGRLLLENAATKEAGLFLNSYGDMGRLSLCSKVQLAYVLGLDLDKKIPRSHLSELLRRALVDRRAHEDRIRRLNVDRLGLFRTSVGSGVSAIVDNATLSFLPFDLDFIVMGGRVEGILRAGTVKHGGKKVRKERLAVKYKLPPPMTVIGAMAELSKAK